MPHRPVIIDAELSQFNRKDVYENMYYQNGKACVNAQH